MIAAAAQVEQIDPWVALVVAVVLWAVVVGLAIAKRGI